MSDKLPVFTWWDQVPDNLSTKTKMRESGRVPTSAPCALIEYGRGRRYRCYELYDASQSREIKPVTPEQRAALEKGRATQDENRRTCPSCQEVKSYYVDGICGDCERASEEAFHRENHNEAVEWARALVARTDWLLIDFETTGLGGYAVEMALLHPDGTTLFVSRFNPLFPIEAGAQSVHGISDADVQNAPTFQGCQAHIRDIIGDRTLVAYNSSFDESVLCREVGRLVNTKPGQREKTWADEVKWEDAMLPYSAWVGEWSDYWRDYKWQQLGGNHGAEGDCRRCLQIIQAMAASALQEGTS